MMYKILILNFYKPVKMNRHENKKSSINRWHWNAFELSK